MELTLDQALQKGIEAHKAGQVQEADRYYTAILKANPKHPDANHNMGVLAVGVGKVQEALPFFKTALDANPKIAQFWLSYIDTLIKLDRLADAKAVFDQAREKGNKGDSFDQIESSIKALSEEKYNKITECINPQKDQLQSLLNLYKKGQLQEALTMASPLLLEFPNSVNLLNVVGSIYQSTGKLEKALETYKKAISIKPDYEKAYNNMGSTLKQQGKLNEAINAYKEAISIKPEYAEAYNNMGNTLKEQGKLPEAILAYEKALAFKPDYAEADMSLTAVKNLTTPVWHIGMMNDSIRNRAYFEALKLAITDKDFVLEIGTGSGLLAMMAASFGAGEVITCETSQTIARKAEEIIYENGYQTKVKVINKKSTDLLVGRDLPKKADIIISEILSSEFVGEGVRLSILDANKRLLAKNGKMLPEGGEIRIALIGDSKEIREQIYVQKINSFDLSKFNSIVGNKFPLKLKNKPNLLSETVVPFKFDLYDTEPVTKKEKTLSIIANESGMCFGIIQWLQIQIFKNFKYENKPGEIFSHWSTPIYSFDKPIDVVKGQEINIKATLFEDSLWFTNPKVN